MLEIPSLLQDMKELLFILLIVIIIITFKKSVYLPLPLARILYQKKPPPKIASVDKDVEKLEPGALLLGM